MFRRIKMASVLMVSSIISIPEALSQEYFGAVILGEVQADLSPEGAETIDRIRAQPSVAAVQVVEVDASAFQSQRVLIDLGSLGGEVYSMQVSSSMADAGLPIYMDGVPFAWTGEVTNQSDTNTLFEVDEEGRIYGAIIGPDGNFELRPIAGGAHALIEYNPNGFPDEHPGELPFAPDAVSEEQGLAPDLPASVPTISVLMVFTEASARQYPSAEAQARLIISSANRVYEQTQIPTRLELADTIVVDYNEFDWTIHQNLSHLRNSSDGHMDEVHGVRDANEADLVHLIAERADYCGLAYVNATASYAFGTTMSHCAIGNLSFTHELGHNFGACHDPANSGSCSPFGVDGYGYQDPDAAFRTVMAYNCAGGCPRIAMLSHPNEFGEAGRHNVRRITHARSVTVSRFR